MFRSRGALLILLLGAASVQVLGRLEAQQSGSPFHAREGDSSFVHVVLVADPTVPAATTMRRAMSEPRNVVIIDPDATDPAALSQVIFGLLVAESTDPDGRRRSDRGAVRMSRPIAAPTYPWAADALDRLRQAEPVVLGELGERPALSLWLRRLRPVEGR
jgi:hypothetical protein